MPVRILKITMHATKPTKHHKGFIYFELQDPTCKLSNLVIHALYDVLNEEQLVAIDSRFEGFSKNGGIYDYNLPFGTSTFQIEVPEYQINLARQKAEDYLNR